MYSEFAASHGEPTYVWRAGQERRLSMIREAAGGRRHGRVLEIGCGLGLYLSRLAPEAASAVGVEYEPGRARAAAEKSGPATVVMAANEALPFRSGHFDMILTNEVIEHVADDARSAAEMVRLLRPGGRIVLFCPNRWYPVEQHGVFWRGRYHFGNIPLVNYLPDALRNRLAPHVRTYTARRLHALFRGLPVRELYHRRIFGGYDNLVARFGHRAEILRRLLHRAEGTRFDLLGLSHFLVLERCDPGELTHRHRGDRCHLRHKAGDRSLRRRARAWTSVTSTRPAR